MANTKISQLTALTTPTGNEELVYAYNNANGKMTLDTMKTFVQPDLSGYQEELVSGTNIKTINGNSILGSGNLVISGGGGAGEDNDYDAVVDANGGGDYTSISDAITAGIKRIYVRNGTYSMSSQTLSTGDFKLVGESETGVIINVTYSTRSGSIFRLTSDTTSESNNFLFKNLTFNVTYTGEYGYFIMFYGMGQGEGFLKIQNCIINMSETTNGCNFYITGGSGNDTLLEQCLIRIYPTTGSFTALGFSGISRKSLCIDSTIIVDASGSIGTSGITFSGNPDGNYINCKFEVGKYHQTTGDIVKLGGNYGLNCSYTSSKFANFEIYGTQECCSFPAIGKNANYDSALNTAVQNKTITIWKPNTVYTVGQYVQSGYGLTIARCKTAHTSGTEYDSTKFEDVYGDVYINGVLKNCSLTVFGTVIIGGISQYDVAFTLPSLLGNVENNTFIFTKPDSSLSNIANIIILGYKGFNNNMIETSDTYGINIYLGGECASFYGNRLISYTGNIYSGGYNNMITNNIWTYVTGQTTPTATQVTSGNSIIDNNIFYSVADWS